MVERQHTLSPCSSSKATRASHFDDISSATHNGSLIPDQGSLSPCASIGGCTNSLAISQQSLLLAELEFRKLFLVYSYVGRLVKFELLMFMLCVFISSYLKFVKFVRSKKLEDVVSVDEAIKIKKWKTMTMIEFEDKIWAMYGCKFCEPCDRAMVCNSVIPLP